MPEYAVQIQDVSHSLKHIFLKVSVVIMILCLNVNTVTNASLYNQKNKRANTVRPILFKLRKDLFPKPEYKADALYTSCNSD